MKKLPDTCFRLFTALALAAIALACVTSFSCQLSPEGITFLRGSYDCPKLLDFSIEGKNELQMTFTQEIEFSEMSIVPAGQQAAATNIVQPSSDMQEVSESPAADDPENSEDSSGKPVTEEKSDYTEELLPEQTSEQNLVSEAGSGSEGKSEAEITDEPAQTGSTGESSSSSSITILESASVTETENGTYQYDLTFSEDFTCDTTYLLYAVVEDEHGNTLSFSSDFTGYNDNLPEIVLSEVRTEWSKPKPEYIELYILKDGNLGGLYIEVYYSSKVNTYTFPAVDVHQGEYIVLHMRSVDEAAFDETDALDACSAPDSCPEARDFWYQSDSKAIGKTGVILLKERGNGPLLDALLYAESSKSSWPKDEMKAAAQAAYMAGIWADGAEPSNAVCSDKCTSTRTISRQDYTTGGASSWIVVATSSATPGAPNSSKRAE